VLRFCVERSTSKRWRNCCLLLDTWPYKLHGNKANSAVSKAAALHGTLTSEQAVGSNVYIVLTSHCFIFVAT
jgi:hypothetical protein